MSQFESQEGQIEPSHSPLGVEGGRLSCIIEVYLHESDPFLSALYLAKMQHELEIHAFRAS